MEKHTFNLFINREEYKFYLSPSAMSIIDNGFINYKFDVINGVLIAPSLKEKDDYLKDMVKLGESLNNGSTFWYSPSGYQLAVSFEKDLDNTIMKVIVRPNNAIGCCF